MTGSTEQITLLQYYPKLKPAEKAVILKALRDHSDMHDNVHAGVLPFVRMTQVVGALVLARHHTGDKTQHLYARILSKLDAHKWEPGMIEDGNFTLHLNDGLVAKYFGKHPEQGVVVPWLPTKKVTAGVKWSLPHGAYIPDENVMVRHIITLKRKGRYLACGPLDMWSISVNPAYRYIAMLWLLDHCTVVPTKRRRRRRRGTG